MLVSADAQVPVDVLRDVLSAIARTRVPIALATPLPPDTRMPEASDASPPEAGLCPDGLPALPADSASGELPVEALLAGLGPLRERGGACLGYGGPAATEGGRVELHFRVGPDGAVRDACVRQDDIGDAAVRDCLLAAARELIFATPEPRGMVDAAIPLALTPLPETELAQRPLCDAP